MIWNGSSVSVTIQTDQIGFGSNGTFGINGTIFGVSYDLFLVSEMLTFTMTEMIGHCHLQSDPVGWHVIKAVVLLTALPANVALMWLLMGKKKKTMSPSEVLGLNVSVMDVLYCLSIPLEIYTAINHEVHALNAVSEALFALNILGCPLLLTSMCLERYMAVARPVTYMRLRRWEYRWAWCASAWVLTAAEALCSYFISMFVMAMYLAVITSVLFLLMLLCLLGIACVLCESGPAGSSGTGVPLKRRALKNIAVVAVPSLVAYSPSVALVPYMAFILSNTSGEVQPSQCHILQLLLMFPNVGLYIGPMFYLSRFAQWACWKKKEENQDSKTLAD